AEDQLTTTRRAATAKVVCCIFDFPPRFVSLGREPCLYVSSGRGRNLLRPLRTWTKSLRPQLCAPTGGAAIAWRPESGKSQTGARTASSGLSFLKRLTPMTAEADDVTLRVHVLHKRIVFGFPHVTGRTRKPHFKIISLCVEPPFYFIGHKSSMTQSPSALFIL